MFTNLTPISASLVLLKITKIVLIEFAVLDRKETLFINF